MKNPSSARYRMLGTVFTVISLMVIGQMLRIQTSASAQSIEDRGKQFEYEKRKIYPERGNIYDRWGHLLAGNVEVYEVGVNLQDVTSPETIATTLATLLDADYAETLGLASMEFIPGEQEYIPLANFVSGEKINQLEELKSKYRDQPSTQRGDNPPSLSGLVWTPYLMRSYPENELAANILGFYLFKDRAEGSGVYGVEAKYNDILAGQPVELMVPRDPTRIEEIPAIPPGSSLLLTIDREIQAMTERVLDQSVKDNGSLSGVIIIADPKTGELLAVAATPRLNPNKYWEFDKLFPDNTPFNRAVEANYEPGSVFKVLTMAAALDAGVVTPDTTFLDTGSIDVGGLHIIDWDGRAWGPQTMTTCMQHSLNVCLAWVATQLGPTQFYEYLKAFGIGHRTNIDLAGETLWPLAVPGDAGWTLGNLATNSFGQGVAVTPMQMVMAVSALANDGKMMAPHVLKAVIDDKRQYNNTPQVVGVPISAETARTITDMLAISLEQEASTALVEGYRVAGKTGTGEIPTKQGYTLSETNASFVGWGPTDDPRFLVYIWFERPKSSIWGSIVAAPVFSEVATNLVKLMNLPPDDQR